MPTEEAGYNSPAYARKDRIALFFLNQKIFSASVHFTAYLIPVVTICVEFAAFVI